jgi:hypothetical protein
MANFEYYMLFSSRIKTKNQESRHSRLEENQKTNKSLKLNNLSELILRINVNWKNFQWVIISY